MSHNDKYIHQDVENRIYSYWEKNKLFKPKKNNKSYFSIKWSDSYCL